MSDRRAGQERERDLDRFLTFVDAVVAIAITLLVLPLVELAGEAAEVSAGELLREHEAQLFGFGLSFVVIARLWFSQHRIVSGLVSQDPLVVRLLMIWTFTIVLLPFPTALVAESGDDSATKVFYVGTMAVSSALLALLAWAVGRDPVLRDTAEAPDPALAAGTAVAFVLALALSLAVPATGYWPLLLLLLPDPVVRRVRLRHARRADVSGHGQS